MNKRKSCKNNLYDCDNTVAIIQVILQDFILVAVVGYVIYVGMQSAGDEMIACFLSGCQMAQAPGYLSLWPQSTHTAPLFYALLCAYVL